MNIESKNVGELCRRYARQIWREQPELTVEDMLMRNEIVWVALDGTKYDRNQLVDWILPDATPHEELPYFRELKLWTVDEAVALWQDVNPFIFLQSFQKFKPAFWNQAFHPKLRENYHVLLEKARRSILTEDLKAVRDNNKDYVTPKNFYEWAIQNTQGPSGDRPAEFFGELKVEWEGGRHEAGSPLGEPEKTSCIKPEGHLNHDPVMQKRANELAEEIIAKTDKSPTKGKIAKKLAQELELTPETVERRIRKEWK